MLIFHTEKHPN